MDCSLVPFVGRGESVVFNVPVHSLEGLIVFYHECRNEELYSGYKSSQRDADAWRL